MLTALNRYIYVNPDRWEGSNVVPGLGLGVLLNVDFPSLFGSRINLGSSYNIKQTQHSDLNALVRSVQMYPHIITMCQVLQPAAEHLVNGHGLTQEDDLVAVTLKLKSLMKEANLDHE